MIIRIEKERYNLVRSDCGKHVKRIGEEQSYSEIAEAKDKPHQYEEVE